MNDFVETSPTPVVPAPFNPFLPITFLAATILVLLISQAWAGWQQRDSLKAMQAQREELVKQSRAIQGTLQKLMEDLLVLAQTDPEARALVDKYKVSRR